MNNKEIKFNSPLDVDYSKFADLHEEQKSKSLKPSKVKFTLSNIIKAQFLIHQINYYTIKKGGLQIHHKTYAEFFSLSPNDFGVIIHFLEDIDIIKCVHKGTHANEEKNITQSLSRYVMVNPFDVNASTQYQTHTYHVDTTINLKQKVKPLPEFLYRYAVDGGVLKNKASMYVKTKMNTDTPKIKVLTKNERIAELEAKVERYEALMNANNIDYSPSLKDIIQANFKPSKKVNSRALQAAAQDEQEEPVEAIQEPTALPEGYDEVNDIYTLYKNNIRYSINYFSVIKDKVADDKKQSLCLNQLIETSHTSDRSISIDGIKLSFLGSGGNDYMNIAIMN